MVLRLNQIRTCIRHNSFDYRIFNSFNSKINISEIEHENVVQNVLVSACMIISKMSSFIPMQLLCNCLALKYFHCKTRFLRVICIDQV